MSKTAIIFARPETRYVNKRVDIHEHRAPTDQSVALLKEMEAAADAKRIASLHLEGNDIHGLVQVQKNMVDDTLCFAAFVDVNGKRLDIRHTVDARDNNEGILVGLRDAIAKRLANEIIEPALDGLSRQLPGLR